MRLDTVLKVGSLAFSVAQDDNIRELFSMVHKGAKRRGFIGAPQQPSSGSKSQAQNTGDNQSSHPVPFSPGGSSSSGGASGSGGSSGNSKNAPSANGGMDWNQMLSGGNAKKLLGVAGQIGQMLMK